MASAEEVRDRPKLSQEGTEAGAQGESVARYPSHCAFSSLINAI